MKKIILFLFPIIAFSQLELNNSTDDYFDFYQKYISGIRPVSCPMYPSCSYFAIDVLKEKGFIEGMSLISDRLIRDGHDAKHYDITLTEKGFKVLDLPYYKNDNSFIYKRNSYSYSYGDYNWDSKEIAFIKNLINNGFYREALLEINRINFFNPELISIELFMNKIICLKALNEYEKAIFEFESKRNIKFKTDENLILEISKIYIKLDNLSKPLEIINESSLEDFSIENQYNFSLLKGYILAKTSKWDESMTSFNKLKNLNIDNNRVDNIITVMNENKNRRKKNPSTAGFLSIVPGAGYYYTENKQTAISSLLINSLLFYATANNLNNKNYGMAALTGIFSLSFYIGNIQGSVLRAKSFNKMSNDKNLQKIKKIIRL